MQKVTKSDIVQYLSHDLGISCRHASMLVDSVLGAIVEPILEGKAVQIPGLFQISLKRKKKRRRDVITGLWKFRWEHYINVRPLLRLKESLAFLPEDYLGPLPVKKVRSPVPDQQPEPRRWLPEP